MVVPGGLAKIFGGEVAGCYYYDVDWGLLFVAGYDGLAGGFGGEVDVSDPYRQVGLEWEMTWMKKNLGVCTFYVLAIFWWRASGCAIHDCGVLGGIFVQKTLSKASRCTYYEDVWHDGEWQSLIV